MFLVCSFVKTQNVHFLFSKKMTTNSNLLRIYFFPQVKYVFIHVESWSKVKAVKRTCWFYSLPAAITLTKTNVVSVSSRLFPIVVVFSFLENSLPRHLRDCQHGSKHSRQLKIAVNCPRIQSPLW